MVKVRALKNLVHGSLSARVGTEFEADDALLQHLLTRKLVEVVAPPKVEAPKPEPVKEVLKEDKIVKSPPKMVKNGKPKSAR
jgi:hypothetical protein